MTNQWVTLNWTVLIGATNYTIQRATNSGGPYLPIASTATTNYTDTTTSNGMTYYYAVSASLRTGETVNSGETQRDAASERGIRI